MISLQEELVILQQYFVVLQCKYGDEILLEFDIPQALLNRRVLKFILQPIVENSIFHGLEPTGSKGHVVVTAREEGGRLLLAVEDDGAGMDEQKLSEVRRRIGESSATWWGSTMSSSGSNFITARNMGWRFSSEKNVGTGLIDQFGRFLRRKDLTGKEGAVINTLKVMVADDEYPIRKWFSRTIKNLPDIKVDFVGAASNGEEALKLFRERKPDVVFTDIKMPIMDGLELLKAVKEERPGTEVIIITSYDEFAYAKAAIAQNAYDYILKTEANPGCLATFCAGSRREGSIRRTRMRWLCGWSRRSI